MVGSAVTLGGVGYASQSIILVIVLKSLGVTKQVRTTRPKISAFPMRRGELPVGSGKFLKNGLILVGSGRVW